VSPGPGFGEALATGPSQVLSGRLVVEFDCLYLETDRSVLRPLLVPAGAERSGDPEGLTVPGQDRYLIGDPVELAVSELDGSDHASWPDEVARQVTACGWEEETVLALVARSGDERVNRATEDGVVDLIELNAAVQAFVADYLDDRGLSLSYSVGINNPAGKVVLGVSPSDRSTEEFAQMESVVYEFVDRYLAERDLAVAASDVVEITEAEMEPPGG
jgi:hypothetical protein